MSEVKVMRVMNIKIGRFECEITKKSAMKFLLNFALTPISSVVMLWFVMTQLAGVGIFTPFILPHVLGCSLLQSIGIGLAVNLTMCAAIWANEKFKIIDIDVTISCMTIWIVIPFIALWFADCLGYISISK